MSKKQFKFVKNFLFWVVITWLFLYIIVKYIDIHTVYEALIHAYYPVLFGAFFVSVIAFLLQIRLYQNALSLSKITIPVKELVKHFYIFVLISIITPFGSSSGSLYFVNALSDKKNIPKRNVFVSVLVLYVVSQVAFVLFSILGLLSLNRSDHLTKTEVVSVLSIIALTVTILLILTGVVFIPKIISKVFRFFSRLINNTSRILKLNIRPLNLADTILGIRSLLVSVVKQKKLLESTFFLYLLFYLGNFVTLLLIASSLGINISISILFSIFVIIVLFSIVSPTPQGIGIAEGIAQIVSVSFGLSNEKAFLLVIIYRLFTLWIPVFTGFLIFQIDRHRQALSN